MGFFVVWFLLIGMLAGYITGRLDTSDTKGFKSSSWRSSYE